jgi:hypothetical protein
MIGHKQAMRGKCKKDIGLKMDGELKQKIKLIKDRDASGT